MRDKPKNFSGTIPWTKINDIEGKFLSRSQHGLCVSNVTIDKMNLQVIPAGSLVLSVSATFGVSAITTQKLVTNQRFIGLVPNNQNQLDFLYISLHTQSFKRQMRLASAGSISFYITRKQVENFNMNIPNDAEKSQIGELFALLDTLIASNQRKGKSSNKGGIPTYKLNLIEATRSINYRVNQTPQLTNNYSKIEGLIILAPP